MSTPARPGLKFASEDEVIADLARLRRGFIKRGNWSLAQIAWHLAIPLDKHLHPPASPDAQPTAEQLEKQVRFVDYIIEHEKAPAFAANAPPAWVPPETADESDIARFEAGLERLKNYAHAIVEMGPLGPVSIDKCRRVHLMHIAHHLSFLEPAAKRREVLRFKSPDEVIADVSALRNGHQQAGNWNLAQMCRHLNTAMNRLMEPEDANSPAPPSTPELRQRVENILQSGKIPSGLQAPQRAVPPAICGDEEVDAFLATLGRFTAFAGPFSSHPRFGKLPDDEMRQLALIHCAHHLSYLTPSQTAAARAES